MRARMLATSIALGLLLLVGVSSAAADKSLSQNWAGYAAHGATFDGVTARWRQPTPNCSAGKVRYSAMWVGLGGYSLTSTALEQIGTELDCNQRGHYISSAWYELVPAASHTLAMKVRPGDLMAAAVGVANHRVTLVLENLSTHRTFTRTFSPVLIDISSAEWILEAPSACVAGTSACRTLPLTNFGHAAFTLARASVVGGQPAPIENSAWTHTRITLGPSGPQFVSNRTGEVPIGTARPSGLINNGSSFKIAYQQRYVPTVHGSRSPRGRTYLRH